MSPLTMLVACLVVAMTAGTADVASIMLARQRAIRAADAAAVAAADAASWLSDASPAAQARALVEANGATFVSCDCVEGAEEVVVEAAVEPSVRLLARWAGRTVVARRRAVVEPWVPSWKP